MHLKNLNTSVIAHVGHTHDPLLKRYVGKKIVLDVVQGAEIHEHIGIQWLQKAYKMRYSLPDNGRCTHMLLQELKRHQNKMPEESGLKAASPATGLDSATSDDIGFTVQTTTSVG